MRQLQNDNAELVARWMALKAKDADRMNAENEEFVRVKQEKERRELLKAATDGVAEVTLGPKPRYLFNCVYWLECRTRNFQVAGSNITVGHLQATLGKLLTYGVLRSTQPPTLHGTGNE